MTYQEQYQRNEIAAKLGISTESVRTIRLDAIKLFVRLLNQAGVKKFLPDGHDGQQVVKPRKGRKGKDEDGL